MQLPLGKKHCQVGDCVVTENAARFRQPVKE
jgi:hypothetical protein